MPTPEQLRRWATDWGAVKAVAGKRVDSVQFAEDEVRERVVVRFFDGTRLCIANVDGVMRAWVSCCGKPDGGPPAL